MDGCVFCVYEVETKMSVAITAVKHVVSIETVDHCTKYSPTR